MKTETALDHLVQAAERLGFTVRATKGNFRGGRCTVDGQPTIVLNTRHLPETRLRVLADALYDAPLETLYLKPTVRDVLQETWADLDLDPDAAGPPGDASAQRAKRQPARASDASAPDASAPDASVSEPSVSQSPASSAEDGPAHA